MNKSLKYNKRKTIKYKKNKKKYTKKYTKKRKTKKGGASSNTNNIPHNNLDNKFKTRRLNYIVQLRNIFNLEPGNTSKLLNMDYNFTNLSEKYPESDVKSKKMKIYSHIQPCRWSVDKKFFDEIKENKYKILVTCENDGDIGIQGLLIAKDHPDDPNGVYIDLFCASELSFDYKDKDDGKWKGRQVNYKMGLILLTTFLSYCKKIGKPNAYLSASIIDLIPIYAIYGWVISNTLCLDTSDKEIIEAFKNLNKKEQIEFVTKLVENPNSGYNVNPKEESYSMKLCDPDLLELQTYTELLFLESALKFTEEELNSTCSFA